MRTALLASAAAIGLLLAPIPAAGQDGQTRQGFWGSLGAGGGWNLSQNLEGKRLSGFTAYARAGYSLSQRWLVGADLIGWGRSENDQTLTRGNLSAALLFYPSTRGGLFFKGGVGVASVEFLVDAASSRRDTGFGSTLGLGYDLRLGSRVYLTATADWLFQDVKSLDTTNQLAMLTLGLTYH